MVGDNNNSYYAQNKGIDSTIFKQHIAHFKKRYKIISIDEAVFMVENNKSFNNHLVITFDDGFKELYEIVFPILKEDNIPACTYLISNCVDNNDLMWRNKLEHIINTTSSQKLKIGVEKLVENFDLPEVKKNETIMQWSFNSWKMSEKENYVNFLWEELIELKLEDFLKNNKPYLSSSQIIEMSNNGWIFGNHTKSHPILSRLNSHELYSEIVDTKEELEKKLKIPIVHFSYPFGNKPNQKTFDLLIKENQKSFKSICGTRNQLNNFKNPLTWERDRLEIPNKEFFIRYNILPLIRSFGLLR